MEQTTHSIKNKVQEFLKTHPNCKSFIQNIVREADEKIKKEKDDYEKQKAFEKAKEICEYDVTSFKKPVLPGYKYKLQLLKTNDQDYKVLENSLKFNDDLETECSQYQLDIRDKIKGLKIYRVVSNDNISTESSDSNRILLLHGTRAQNVEGILKIGFIPSQSGAGGPGVYLTNSFKYGYSYSGCIATEENTLKRFRYFFVNSVPNPNIYLKSNRHRNVKSFENYLKREPTVKLLRRRLTKIKESPLDLFDSRKRKILKGTFQNQEKLKNMLAHHDLVEPAFLIEIEEKTNVHDIVKGTLNSLSKLGLYSPHTLGSLAIFEKIYQKTNEVNNNKVSQYSITTIAEELYKVIRAKHLSKVYYLISQLENDTSLIMKQLSFRLSSIFELSKEEKRKFSTEILQKDDGDYKFIVRSFATEKIGKINKISKLFRINPINKTKVAKLKHKHLYLNGVEINKVKYVLTNGYPKDQKERNNSEINFTVPTIDLYNESHRKICCCEIDNEVKKLSFVFVVSSEVNYKDCYIRGKKLIEDSRKSSTREGLFSSYLLEKESNHLELIPAYLIIFELN